MAETLKEDFVILQQEEVVKELKGLTVTKAFQEYNNHAQSNGYTQLVTHQHSMGYMAWQNVQGDQLVLQGVDALV